MMRFTLFSASYGPRSFINDGAYHLLTQIRINPALLSKILGKLF